MSDYISREAALDAVCEDCSVKMRLLCAVEKNYCARYKAVKATPAADVRSVVYGEWINKAYGVGWCSAECSICGNHVGGKTRSTGFGFEYEFPKLCDNCGADMTGDAEGGTP